MMIIIHFKEVKQWFVFWVWEYFPLGTFWRPYLFVFNFQQMIVFLFFQRYMWDFFISHQICVHFHLNFLFLAIWFHVAHSKVAISPLGCNGNIGNVSIVPSVKKRIKWQLLKYKIYLQIIMQPYTKTRKSTFAIRSLFISPARLWNEAKGSLGLTDWSL